MQEEEEKKRAPSSPLLSPNIVGSRQSQDSFPGNINNSSVGLGNNSRLMWSNIIGSEQISSTLDEPLLDITVDPITLNELYDIDPPDGLARNVKFDEAASEFI